MALAVAFVVFLTVDQSHWWQLRSDYAFGWLVPLLVGFVVVDRWSKLKRIIGSGGESPLPSVVRSFLGVAVGTAFFAGMAVFLMGAVYRAGAGVTQPGSLALAIGFSGVLLGLVYFNVPNGCVGDKDSRGWSRLRGDARLRAAGLFLFPALVWMLSAPLVTAVENAVSLFLLRKVVTVVFTLFGLLGYPLIQEGNVLILPHGQVGVADACSGIRSLTACLFAGSFLAAVYLEKIWSKILLVAVAMGLAFVTNLIRSVFLTSWAYAYGSDSIEGRLHDATGFAVLGLTTLCLFCLLPLFRASTWNRWFGLSENSDVGGV